MIEAPLNALFAAIIPILKSDAAMQALIGQRVYDAAPKGASYPYVSLGAAWESQDDADCIPSLEIGFRLDVWSAPEQSTGSPEMRRITHRVRTLLHEVDLDLFEGALAMLAHRRTDVMRDPATKIAHAAIEFTAVIETDPAP